MPISSPTVFPIVEDDLKPDLTGTLEDANGTTMDKSAYTLKLAVRPVAGGSGQDLAATWDGTKPKLVWTAGNKLALGSYYARWLWDPTGPNRQSSPLEDPFTIVVLSKTGA